MMSNKNDNLKHKLGLRIKELRLANGFTQESLSEKINMERSNLARIESGKQFPNAENIEKFALIFNIEQKDLFDFGHYKSKELLIREICEQVNLFDLDRIRYIHKNVMNLKNIK